MRLTHGGRFYGASAVSPRLGANAADLCGPVEIPEHLLAAVLQRAIASETAGTAHA